MKHEPTIFSASPPFDASTIRTSTPLTPEQRHALATAPLPTFNIIPRKSGSNAGPTRTGPDYSRTE